jgi:hypothetical protein
MQVRVLRLPGLPEIRGVPPSVSAITQPVQIHVERFEVKDRRRFLGMAAQQPDRWETEALASRCQRMQMVGIDTAQAHDPLGTGLMGSAHMVNQLEPLVAADQGVNLIQTQHRHFNSGTGEPAQMKAFQAGLGAPVEAGKQHCSRPSRDEPQA